MLRLIISALAVSVIAKSVCIVTDSSIEKDYSKLIGELKKDYTVTIQTESQPIIEHEELKCDNLVLMVPELKKWTAKLSQEIIEEFVSKGGNLLLVGSPESRQPIRSLALNFGFDMQPNGYYLSDTEDGSKISVQGQTISSAKVVFKGIGHNLVQSNPLVFSVLKGGAFSVDPKEKKSVPVKNAAAFSLLQARNNARVGFVGSMEFFADASDNIEFIRDVLPWIFQQKQVLRVAKVNHHKFQETDKRTHYRVKDDFVYTLSIEQLQNDKWIPFKLPANDAIQLELVMIDPYVRLNLKPSNKSVGTYEVRTVLPDVYGVYTLKVDYKRHGWSYIEEKEVVSIVPFRHDEYPRFLVAAYPYYVSVGIGMVSFVVFVAFYMFYSDKPAAVTVKKPSSKPQSEKPKYQEKAKSTDSVIKKQLSEVKESITKVELVKGPADMKKAKKQN